jgi:lysyl-tRNA synthetase class 2
LDIELLRERARIFREIRRFFDERGYLEVVTPVLAPDLIPESCLEVFGTEYLPPKGSSRRNAPYYLVPSPEIWMKRLIADTHASIYQVCPCFRNGESVGHLHSPEFTMLEYYTMGANYEDSISITEELFLFLLPEPIRKSLCPPFLRLSMDEAFSRFAGFSLFDAIEKGTLEAEARNLGLEGTDTQLLYDLVFIHSVEPNLPRSSPVILMDYPSFVPCLAKRKDEKTMERWELYVRGVELANCYSEETDPETVRAYFEAESAVKRQNALVQHKVDENYWKIFQPRDRNLQEVPFPHCSGVAMGVDRLVMSLTGKSAIDSVLPFPMKR